MILSFVLAITQFARRIRYARLLPFYSTKLRSSNEQINPNTHQQSNVKFTAVQQNAARRESPDFKGVSQ
jgi:hypothetical protein